MLKGRIPYVDANNPDAWGRCDKTGLPTMYQDLVPQYEYFGNTLKWTGLMVNKNDVDEPNPQLCTPPMKPDPVPVKNPRRFPLPSQPGVPTGLYPGMITKNSIVVNWTEVANADQYAVYWQSSLGSWSTVEPINGNALPQPNPVITGTIYPITGLQPSTAYVISVASLNNFGYQVGVDGVSTIQSYNISAQSYGPQVYTFGPNKGQNPYAPLFITTPLL